MFALLAHKSCVSSCIFFLLLFISVSTSNSTNIQNNKWQTTAENFYSCVCIFALAFTFLRRFIWKWAICQGMCGTRSGFKRCDKAHPNFFSYILCSFMLYSIGGGEKELEISSWKSKSNRIWWDFFFSSAKIQSKWDWWECIKFWFNAIEAEKLHRKIG